jgi:hypothetical protein
MQIKLPLHTLQKIVTGLDQSDPDDMAGPFRPFAGFLDWDVGDLAAPGINGRIYDADLVARTRYWQFGFDQHDRTSRRSWPLRRRPVQARGVAAANLRSASLQRPAGRFKGGGHRSKEGN